MSKEDSLKKKIFICHLCKKAFLKENLFQKHKRKCLQRQVEPENSDASGVSISVHDPDVLQVGIGTVESEYENSYASRVSITVPNPNVPQFSIGTVEPEPEKNPQHENVEILDQSYDKVPDQVMIS